MAGSGEPGVLDFESEEHSAVFDSLAGKNLKLGLHVGPEYQLSSRRGPVGGYFKQAPVDTFPIPDLIERVRRSFAIGEEAAHRVCISADDQSYRSMVMMVLDKVYRWVITSAYNTAGLPDHVDLPSTLHTSPAMCDSSIQYT